jgi:hypothetical protein
LAGNIFREKRAYNWWVSFADEFALLQLNLSQMMCPVLMSQIDLFPGWMKRERARRMQHGLTAKAKVRPMSAR